MKKVFCIAPLVFALISAAYTATQAQTGGAPAIRYDNAAGIIIRTQQGSGAFSWNRLTASLPFRYGYAAVSGGSGALLSGFSGAATVSTIRYASAVLESAAGVFTLGVRAGLTEWELNRLRIRLPNTELREQYLVHRFYHTGVSAALPAHTIRYDGDWYWGRLSIGLHDLGPFIAQPLVDATASIHRFRVTNRYEGGLTFFQLQGILTNKNREPIASGAADTFIFKNTVYIPIATHSELSLSASSLSFSGIFSVRLTAENQGYFLFPYRFYDRDIELSGFAVGLGARYRYTTRRFRFYGTTLFYSIVQAAGSDSLHSKEKKSFLFKGKEEKSNIPLPEITGTSLLLLRISLGFAVTPNAELSAGKVIPVPILSPQLTKRLNEQTTDQGAQPVLIIDPLLTGFSVRLTIRL